MIAEPSPRTPGTPGVLSTVWPLVAALALGLLRPAESYASSALVLAGLALISFLRSKPVSRDVLAVAVLPVLLVPWCLAMPMPSAAVGALVPFALAFCFGTAASRISNDLGREILLKTFVVVAAMLAMWGLWQRFYGLQAMFVDLGPANPTDAFATALRARLSEGRAFATLPTPAAFAVVMAMAIPISGELFFRTREKMQQTLWGLLMVLSLAGLWAAASFTGLVALIGGGACVAVGRPRLRRHAMWVIPLSVLAVAGLVVVRGAALWGTVDEPSPLRLRAGNVRIASEMAADHPWAGVGPGMYGERYPQYRRAPDNETRHAHNLPAEWLAEWGLPLGSIFVVLFFLFYLSPALRPDLQPAGGAGPAMRFTAVGPTWAVASFALHNLLDFSSFLPSVLWTASILCGLCSLRSGATHPAAGRHRQFAFLAAMFITALAVSDSVGKIYEESATREARAERPQAALIRYERGLRWAPWNTDLLVGRVGSAFQRDDPRVQTFLEIAQRRAPYRASLHAWAARLAESRRDPVGAWAHWGRAAELYPLRKQYRQHRDAWARVLQPDVVQ